MRATGPLSNAFQPLDTNLDSSCIFVTIPVPIVFPDSRIVNRWPGSIGIPLSDIALMSTVTLSPGITISTSGGNSTCTNQGLIVV